MLNTFRFVVSTDPNSRAAARRERGLRLLLFLLTGLGLLAPATALAQVTAKAVASRTSGISPLGVFFDTSGLTTDSDGSVDVWDDLTYQWNTGDDRTDLWLTGRSKQTARGPLMAHVYEPQDFPDCGGTCKRYTVTLTVTDPSQNTAQWQEVITVYDPDQTGANGWGDPGETICISATDDGFGGCPSGADHSVSSDFDASIDSAVSKGYKRILFDADDTFNINSTVNLSNGVEMIGAYNIGTNLGKTNRATVNLTSAVDVFASFPSAHGIRIQDFHFTGTGNEFIKREASTRDGVKGALLQRMDSPDRTFNRIESQQARQMTIGSSNPEGASQMIWSELEFGETRDYTVAMSVWYRTAILGCKVDSKSTTGAHVFRIQGAQHLLWWNNDIGPGKESTNGKHAITLRDLPDDNQLPDCPNDPTCGQGVKNILIAENIITQGNGAAIADGGCSGAATCSLTDSDILIQDNEFKQWPEPTGGRNVTIGYKGTPGGEEDRRSCGELMGGGPRSYPETVIYIQCDPVQAQFPNSGAGTTLAAPFLLP
jgi:hypothetical protein